MYSLITLLLYVEHHHTVMRHLTTRIYSEKCVVKRFCRRANVTECTYKNPR